MNAYRALLPVSCLVAALLTVGSAADLPARLHAADTAVVRFVAADGDCHGRNPCYANLQAAVDAAAPGDELHIAGGTYTGVTARGDSTQLLYLDKTLTLRGGYDPQSWVASPDQYPTLLDAQDQGRVITIHGPAAPTLRDLHIVHGRAVNGGGVYLNGATATLRANTIAHNHAEGGGGGVYVQESAATLTANVIFSNTTGAQGRGGGLALVNSPAQVVDNHIAENRAHVGGGVILSNSLSQTGASLTGNVILANVAFDIESHGYTIDGAGGGIAISSMYTDTLQGNRILGNSAKWGGGIHAFDAVTAITANQIQTNTAPTHGGGLFVQNSRITLSNNQIIANRAGSFGGGLYLIGDDSTVSGNLFADNHAGTRGGGFVAESNAQFDANVVRGNTADWQGGGIFVLGGTRSRFANTVVQDNTAPEGGGIYLWGATTRWEHTTVTANQSNDDRAIVLDTYPGLISPGEPIQSVTHATFTNSIITGQPTGFFVTPANHLTVTGVLWHAVATPFQAAGATIAVSGEVTGDPLFQADGYHLHATSPARDLGVVVIDSDVDGQLRGPGAATFAAQRAATLAVDLGADLGADEFVPTALIDPTAGGSVTYVHPQDALTITVNVPPQTVTHTFALQIAPFPPLPPGALDSPLGAFVAVGPPFMLLPFSITVTGPDIPRDDPPVDSPYPDEYFYERYPAELIAEVGLDKMKRMRASMDRLELALLAIIDRPTTHVGFGPPGPPPPLPPSFGFACAAPTVDADHNRLTTPICNTGVYTGSAQSADTLTVAATYPVTVRDDGTLVLPLAAQGAATKGMFVLVLRLEPLYLPLIRR